jgi:branched-chain amino acid transport system permease protein
MSHSRGKGDKYFLETKIIRAKKQLFALLGFLVALAILPFVANSHVVSLLILISITITAVHGVNIVLGFCGEITVAQAAFVGISAYCYAILFGAGCPWIIAMGAGVLLTCFCGVLFGLPALRVKGFYLLMVTLGAQFIIPWIFAHWKSMTGGLVWGKPVPEIKIGSAIIDTDVEKYFLIVGISIVMTFLVFNIQRSKLGRALTAIRDNHLAAEAMGINVFGYKLIAFFLCSFFAGVSGFMWAVYTEHLFPDHFYLMDSIWYIAMIIVGGMGTITGAILGTFFLLILSELTVVYGPVFTKFLPLQFGMAAGVSLGTILFAVIIMLFLIYEPRGINHRLEIVVERVKFISMKKEKNRE